MFLRVLEIVFFIYFASHIPITLMIDLQALLPEHVYPPEVSLNFAQLVAMQFALLNKCIYMHVFTAEKRIAMVCWGI